MRKRRQIAAAVIVPVLFFFCVELFFRLTWREQSPRDDLSAYLKLPIPRRCYIKEEVTFGRASYRACQDGFPCSPERIEMPKQENVRRIIIVGESIALPFKGELFSSLLAGLVSDKKVEVINCAKPAYDSHRVCYVIEEMLSYSPDVIVVMSGNNEFYNSQPFDSLLAKAERLLKKLSLAYAWMSSPRGISSRGFAPLNAQQRLENYSRNLRFMVRTAKSRKVPIALCTAPINIRDCPPLVQPPNDERYWRAKLIGEAGNRGKAIELFATYLKRSPGDAMAHFNLAKMYDAQGDFEKARYHYLKSAYFSYGKLHHACAESNEIVRAVCQQEGAVLVDIEWLFSQIAPQGMPGYNMFIDSCHWHGQYNKEVMSLVASAIGHPQKPARVQGAITLPETRSIQHPPQEGLNKIKEAAALVIKWRYSPNERAIALFEFARQIVPETLLRLKENQDEIRQQLAADYWLKNRAEMLEDRWGDILAHVGECYRRQGFFREAEDYFKSALAFDSQDHLARLGRALLLATLGGRRDALAELEYVDRGDVGEGVINAYREYILSKSEGKNIPEELVSGNSN